MYFTINQILVFFFKFIGCLQPLAYNKVNYVVDRIYYFVDLFVRKIAEISFTRERQGKLIHSLWLLDSF